MVFCKFIQNYPMLPYITWPIAGQCIFICQCHQQNLYVNETGLLPGMGKLNDFSSYNYVCMYWSGP